jgi:hypothetical protein
MKILMIKVAIGYLVSPGIFVSWIIRAELSASY